MRASTGEISPIRLWHAEFDNITSFIEKKIVDDPLKKPLETLRSLHLPEEDVEMLPDEQA